MKTWMITLKEKYVHLFLTGKKCIELRTRVPKALQQGDEIIVAQSGSHNKIVMKMTVSFVYKFSPTTMFHYFGEDIQVDYNAYKEYTKGREYVYGIGVYNILKLNGEFHTSDFGINKAPQWFREVKEKYIF